MGWYKIFIFLEILIIPYIGNFYLLPIILGPLVIFGAANGSNSYSGILPELKLFNTTEAPNWARKI
jgi:hypothetical protein